METGSFGEISVNWGDFKKYVESGNYRGYYGSQIFNCAMQYGKCLFNHDFSEIKLLSESKKAHALKSLSALAKFVGCYEDFKTLLKNYGLTWVGRSAEDLIIDRLNKTSDANNVFQWIKDVKEARPEYEVFMDFIAITGLRLSEAVNSYNLIIQFTSEKSLTEKYYNVNTGLLEHFRIKDPSDSTGKKLLFIRSCKKAFVSYVPLELLELIGKQSRINENRLKNKALSKRHIPQRFSDVRENHASFVTQWLRPEEIDFLHGRVSSSVFMRNYYNPKLVGDLRFRIAQAAQAILLKIDSSLVIKRENEVKGGENIHG